MHTGRFSNFPSSIRSGRNFSAYSPVSCDLGRKRNFTYVLSPHLGVPLNHVDVEEHGLVFIDSIFPPNHSILERRRTANRRRGS